ncbi:MAG TPA: glycosyl hydrolase 53 family protein [Gemmatimonadales bacterium]|jgi:arabinogalactan endo-1,4-beta-galactosidase
MITRKAPGRQPDSTWRTGLLAGVLALVLAACGSSPVEVGAAGGMLVGADVSALERIEQAGGVFKDGGTAGDAIAILHAHGANIFRLRLFVNPNDSDVQVNDLAYTIRMGKRVKAAGARLLLDIHYSDTWADPGHQATPAAWTGLPPDSLEERVETYTSGAVGAMKAAGALPDMVQVGNEVDAGMLWPVGQLTGTGDTTAQWDRFTRLLKAGIRGVHDALAPGDSVRTLIHYSLGDNLGGTQWFFDHITAAGVPFDLIGLSYYPWWHGTLDALRTNMDAAAERYGKPILVVETEYPWRAGGWESMVSNRALMAWPATPGGQRQFLADLLGAVAAVPDSRGAGVIWWYPESIQVSGLFAWAGGSLALFDAGGNVLPAASVFGAP